MFDFDPKAQVSQSFLWTVEKKRFFPFPYQGINNADPGKEAAVCKLEQILFDVIQIFPGANCCLCKTYYATAR